MEDLKLVTYCGLYCDLCSTRGRIPKQARDLLNSMKKESYDEWGSCLDNFDSFWKFLNNICKSDEACPGCRSEGGFPNCKIRECAKEKNIDICINCDKYPCELITNFNKVYPTLISDGLRHKKIGTDAWINEQENRCKTGFVYADIRCRGCSDS